VDPTGGLHVAVGVGDEDTRQAACIWARAKARRDRAPEPESVEQALPGVRRRLALDGSTLLLARRDDRALGFALSAPRAATLELFYLAVSPDDWGVGVAALLLAAVDEQARSRGCEQMELWVLDDNTRAIMVYGRAGWVRTDELVRDPASGRVERRLVRRLAAVR
jgi:GNAT superfamily N-acetyltransferase